MAVSVLLQWSVQVDLTYIVIQVTTMVYFLGTMYG